MNISQAIIGFYPEIDPLVDFIVQDDGEGQYLKEWNYSKPRPTDEQMETGWANCLESQNIELARIDRESQIISMLGAKDKQDAIIKQINIINEALATGNTEKIQQIDSAIKVILQ